MNGFKNKMTTVELAIERYGAIDFASGHWPEQNQWIRILQIPPGMFPKWYVLNTRMPVKHIACNYDIAPPLMRALQAISEGNLQDQLETFDGCFNIRLVRGSSHAMSAHSYGLAIDLNADDNELGQTEGGFYKSPEFVKCFTDQGFDWGGSFHSRKDPMHFSYAWE